MVKILQIISILLIILAVFIIILPFFGSLHRNPEIEKILKEPLAAEKFASERDRSNKREEPFSPLVKHATDFSNYLNPPPPPPPAQPIESPERPEVTPPALVTPKFNVIGTSYYAQRPELSWALIDEPGSGLRWVKEGNNIGHIKIEKVKDGSITVSDGQRKTEMIVKRDELWRNLVKKDSAVLSQTNASDKTISLSPTTASVDLSGQSRITNKPTITPAQRRRANLKDMPALPGAPKVSPTIKLEQSRDEKNTAPQNLEVEESPLIKEKEAQIDRLMEKANSAKLSEEEATKINDEIFKLIEELGDARAAEQSKQEKTKK